jgi:hypothetical protein
MLEFTIYFIASIIILIGAINWGTIGFFGVNLIKQLNDYTFQNTSFEQVIYILIGLAGVYMLFNRTYYLPFLGKMAFPPSAISLHENNSQNTKTFNLEDLGDAKMVVYWAAKSGNGVEDHKTAYGDYSNYGVTKVEDGKATIKVECPQNYKVKQFGVFEKQLSKHVHYRTIHDDGLFSAIRTLDVSKSC